MKVTLAGMVILRIPDAWKAAFGIRVKVEFCEKVTSVTWLPRKAYCPMVETVAGMFRVESWLFSNAYELRAVTDAGIS